MKKTSIFKALALGLLSGALPLGSAHAAGPSNCPAFNAAMVDAAALSAKDISTNPAVQSAVDDPSTGSIECSVITVMPNSGFFTVIVDGVVGDALISATNTSSGGGDITIFRNGVDGLSAGQAQACRGQVLQTWVWNQICASAVQ